MAWEIGRDRRFDPKFGILDALFYEIDRFPGDVIISSEDFENSISRPERWVSFLRRANSSGLRTLLIIYLREQRSYLESLYQEMLKYGFGEEYADYIHAALTNGILRLHEWEFNFNYYRMAAHLSQLSNVEIIFRNYHTLISQSPIADLLSVVGAPLSLFTDSAEIRANARQNLVTSLSHFYRNRINRDLTPQEGGAIQRLCSGNFSHATTTGILRRNIELEFSTGNAKVCDHYGISKTGLVPGAGERPPESDSANMQKLFSFETQSTIREIARLGESSERGTEDNSVAGLVRDWLSWVRESGLRERG